MCCERVWLAEAAARLLSCVGYASSSSLSLSSSLLWAAASKRLCASTGPLNPFPRIMSSSIVTKVKRSVLLATLPSLAAPHFLTQVIHTATSLTSEQIVIVLFSRFFNTGPRPKTHGRRPSFPETQALCHADTGNFSTVQKLLTFVYVQATKVAQEQGKILLDITVLLKGLNDPLSLGSISPELVFRVSGGRLPNSSQGSCY